MKYKWVLLVMISASCASKRNISPTIDYPYSEEQSEVYYGHFMDVSETEKESFLKRAGSGLSIYIYSTYQDSITLTINNRVIYEGKLAILTTNGHERLHLHIDKSNYEPFMVMTIYSHMNKEKMDFALDTRFPACILSRDFDEEAPDPPADWNGPLPYSWNISYNYSVGM